jgi:hypothetical protein
MNKRLVSCHAKGRCILSVLILGVKPIMDTQVLKQFGNRGGQWLVEAAMRNENPLATRQIFGRDIRWRVYIECGTRSHAFNQIGASK